LIGIVVFAAVLAVVGGYGFYQASLRPLSETRRRRGTALQLVDAFVSNYSILRKSSTPIRAPVPATFRAHSIASSIAGGAEMRCESSGSDGPGDRRDTPSDPNMPRSSILRRKHPVAGLAICGGRRRVGSSARSTRRSPRDQSCVDCHNRIQPEQSWKLNDVMGGNYRTTRRPAGRSCTTCASNASAFRSFSFC